MNNQTENMENQTPATEAPAPQGVLSFTVPAVTLRAAVKACAPAMSEDKARFILCALHLELRPNTLANIKDGCAAHVLTVAGCDGRRLHVAQIPVYDLPPSPGRNLSFILPAPAVSMLLKTCLPAKVKHGEALLTVTSRAAAVVNPTPVQWLTVNTPAGEVSNPEQGGNYPNIRQVIPRPTIADDSYSLSSGDLRNMGEIEEDMEANFTDACERAAWSACIDSRLPFTFAQIKTAIAKDVKRMIRKAREHNNSCYFERTHAGRLIPLPLTLGPVPQFQVMNDGRVNILGADKVSLCYGGNPVSIVNAPGPASACFNPAYLADLHEAIQAFDSAPGSPCGALEAHDKESSFCTSSKAYMDKGRSFTFVAVVMPQRCAR